jgi:hypothetical protein
MHNHPGTKNRPVEATVLRRQSHLIITNQPKAIGAVLSQIRYGEKTNRILYSPHFTRKSLRGEGGVGSGAVRGESVVLGGLKDCYWWKTV